MYHLHVYASLPSASPPARTPRLPMHPIHVPLPCACPQCNLMGIFFSGSSGGGGSAPQDCSPTSGTRLDKAQLFLTPLCICSVQPAAQHCSLPVTPPLEIKKGGRCPLLFSTARVKCRPSPPSPWGGFSTLLYLECSKCFAELGPWALPAPEPQRGAGPPLTGFSSAGEIGCKKGQIRHQPGRRRGGC